MLKYIVSVIVVFNFICLSSSAFFVIAFDKVMKELNFSLYLIKLLICEMLTPVIQAVDGQTVWCLSFVRTKYLSHLVHLVCLIYLLCSQSHFMSNKPIKCFKPTLCNCFMLKQQLQNHLK